MSPTPSAPSTVAYLPGTSVETRWVLVTPQMASEMLRDNTANRSMRAAHLAQIATDLAAGRFLITHQGIAFDDKGILIDGQHRLQGIVTSDVAQWLLVTIGLPTEAQRVVDSGAKRKAADFLGGKHASYRTAASRIILATRATGGRFTVNHLAVAMPRVTNAEIHALDEPTAELLSRFATAAKTAADNLGAVGPSPLLAAAALYPTTAPGFLEGLHTMAGLEQGDPRLALLRFRGGGGRVQTSQAAFVCIKTARAYAHGVRLGHLRIGPNEELVL